MPTLLAMCTGLGLLYGFRNPYKFAGGNFPPAGR